MIWVVIGQGANCLRIPALVFTSEKRALTLCKDVLGDDFTTTKDDNGGITSYTWKSKKYAFSKEQYEKFFFYHYEGCYQFILMPIEEGKPFVAWDLD